MEQGSSSKTAKIRSALWCDPRESIKDLNSPELHFKVQLYDSVRFSLQELKHVMFIVHRHTKEKHSPCLFRKCQQDKRPSLGDPASFHKFHWTMFSTGRSVLKRCVASESHKPTIRPCHLTRNVSVVRITSTHLILSQGEKNTCEQPGA